MKCGICGKTIEQKQAHSGEPLVKGYVCSDCNWKVIKERLKISKDQESKKEETPATEDFINNERKSLQNEVDSQIRKYGRIGGGLYDKADELGCYIDNNNKVKLKSTNQAVAEESIAVIGTDGPVNTTDPMADFEKYAKQFEEMFVLGDTPVRKEEPKNNTKVKDGEVTGEVSSMDKDDKSEQVEPMKSATEGFVHSYDEFMEMAKICREIGIEDFGGLSNFIKENPGVNTLDSLKKYKEELGEDFQIKKSEA